MPAAAGIRYIPCLHPDARRALIEFLKAVLRQDTALTSRDKELNAAFVCGFDACPYCRGVHGETAQAIGIGAGLIERLLSDFDLAFVDARPKPLLAYARQCIDDAAVPVQHGAGRVEGQRMLKPARCCRSTIAHHSVLSTI